MKRMVLLILVSISVVWANSTESGHDNHFKELADIIKVDIIFINDLIGNAYGSLNSGSVNLGLIDAMFHINLDKLSNWTGASVFFDGIAAYGSDPGRVVGDVQGVSNIAAENTIRLYEFWLMQEFRQGNGSVLAGIYDLNSEFDVNEFSRVFMNGSFGMGPDFSQSGVSGAPTYPNPALTLRFHYDFNEQYYWQAAVADGNPVDQDDTRGLNFTLSADEGALICIEFGLQTHLERLRKSSFKYERQHIRRSYLNTGSHKYKHHQPRRSRHDWSASDTDYPCRKYYKLAAGIWYYTSEIENFLINDYSPEYSWSWGAYLLGEKVLWSRSEKFVSGFFRAGYANPAVNPVTLYYSSGLVYAGSTSRSRYHQLGLAVAMASLSDDYLKKVMVNDQETDKVEIAFELICRLRMNQWIMVQPDLQYIINPGVNPESADALVPGLRLEISL